MDATQPTLYPYAQRAQMASNVIEAGPAQFQALQPDQNSHNFLLQKFGDKYIQLIDRYGAAEMISDEEGNIIDVTSPEEYLEDSDKRILHGLATNSYDQEIASLIPTAKALYQLACAERSLIASTVYQLRAEPEYLCTVVETSIFHCPELVRDAKGHAPNVNDLLANAHCIAQEIRYTIHNRLLELGQWALISQYLKEVSEIEEKLGYIKSQGERTRLMNAARDLVEQAMEFAAKLTARAVTRHPKFEGCFVRNFDHVPKWTGSELEPVGAKTNSLLEARNLHGALFRFSFIANMESLDGLSITGDLIKEFSRASPAEHEELGDHLVDCISRVKSFWDFYQVLRFRNKSEPFFDPRLQQFSDNSGDAQKILDAAPIERYIKGVASLGKEATVQKIWSEIDKICKKRRSNTIEKLIGYQKPAPRWYIAPRVVRPTTHSDLTTESAARLPRASITPLAATERVTEQEPAKLKPYSYLSDIQTAAEVETETTLRVGPKVKRTGTPWDTTSLGAQPTEPTNAPSPPVLFVVRKWNYEVFEKIFDLSVKGALKQRDFIQAMCHIGFSLQQSEGSRFTMNPPEGNQPFKDHSLHNGDGEMDVAHRRRCAKRLTEDYGWALASFRVVLT